MTTAFTITDKAGTEHKVKIMTAPKQGLDEMGVESVMHQCDDDWLPVGILATSLKAQSEENFHLIIRKEKIAEGTFVLNESTNPELNPELYNDGTEEE